MTRVFEFIVDDIRNFLIGCQNAFGQAKVE